MNALSRLPLLISASSLAMIAFGQVPIAKDGRVEKIGAPKTGLNPQDIAFVKDIAAGSTFEVRSSQLAVKAGSSVFVKRFAKEMIVDHSASFEELKQLARRKRLRITKTLPSELQSILDRLGRLKGSAFDAAYLNAQKAAHTETIAKLKREIQSGRDGDIKGFAIKTLPTVEMHAKMLSSQQTMTGHHR